MKSNERAQPERLNSAPSETFYPKGCRVGKPTSTIPSKKPDKVPLPYMSNLYTRKRSPSSRGMRVAAGREVPLPKVHRAADGITKPRQPIYVDARKKEARPLWTPDHNVQPASLKRASMTQASVQSVIGIGDPSPAIDPQPRVSDPRKHAPMDPIKSRHALKTLQRTNTNQPSTCPTKNVEADMKESEKKWHVGRAEQSIERRLLASSPTHERRPDATKDKPRYAKENKAGCAKENKAGCAKENKAGCAKENKAGCEGEENYFSKRYAIKEDKRCSGSLRKDDYFTWAIERRKQLAVDYQQIEGGKKSSGERINSESNDKQYPGNYLTPKHQKKITPFNRKLKPLTFSKKD